MKSAFADDASVVTRLLSPDPEFDEFVYRSLKPLSISLVIIFSVFVLLGFIDHDAGDARVPIVATDATAVVIFLAIYLALRANVVSRRLTYPLGIVIASVPLANSLLAFALTENPFFLSYLPMIAIVCGAYMLSLPWLLATLFGIFVATFVVVTDVLPMVTAFRYLPALVGAYFVSFLIFFTRRWHIIDTQRALLAHKAEAAERKRVESRLAHAQRLESIGQLVSGIAHDFNNLLTIILGYTDSLLKSSERDVSLVRDLQEIQGAGQRASALAQNLLAFSRQQLMQMCVVEIDDLIVNARPLISRSMPASIALRFDLGAAKSCVEIDPLQMEQVLVNLALNARDAIGSERGELTIATKLVQNYHSGDSNPEQVEIRVSDTGGGMTEEIRERVFEPFFTTKERGSGTGLGLAMAHGIVTQSGGTIEIDSSPGRGTTFIIRLPRRIAPPDEKVASSIPMTDGANLANTRVLVVDDERAICDIVSRTLKQYGCEVEVASSGEQALEIAGRNNFQLLLTDISMPGISGIELLDTLQERGFSGQALFMSGHPAEIASGADSEELPLLHKPFGAQQLLRAVTRIINVRQRTGNVEADSVPASENGWSHHHNARNSSLRILLIDDHEALLRIVADMIRGLGHHCVTCSDAGKALEILHEQHGQFDVVMTDYSMPGVTGREILRDCRRNYPHLHTLLLTGYSEDDAAALARGNGADGVLQKPPNRQTLSAALDRVNAQLH